MIYNKIRHAEDIRKLYRLRNLLAHNKHPDIGARLGYQKYSKRYYLIREKLKKEKILDREGRFVESITNKWMSELPTMIKNKDELHVLGFPPAFSVYLALFFKTHSTLKNIITELEMNERTAYKVIKKLEDSLLVVHNNSLIRINEDCGFYEWLSKYIHLCIVQADTDDDISVLFDCVPAYVDGPQAYYMVNYEAGRPVGPAHMIIRTNLSYEPFWEYAKNKVRYFIKFPKKIIILPSTKDAKIIWLNGIPYNKNATEVL